MKTQKTSHPTAKAMRRLRQVSQILFLLLFIALLLGTRGGQPPSWLPGNSAETPAFFFRLDPLSWAAAVIAGRNWLPGLGLALLTVALTLLAGRLWCGWLCPLGTILDGLSFKSGKRRNDAGPGGGWRKVKTYLLLLLLGAAAAGSLSLLVLDPLSLLTRGLVSFILPGLNQTALWLEGLLYDYSFLQPALDSFESAIRGSLFPADVWRWWNILPGLLLLAFIALNALSERFWCRYLCPLGALLGWLSRGALIRREVQVESCRNCALCARQCPMGTIDSGRGFASDPAECTVCLDCLTVCPTADGQSFKTVRKLAPAQEYDPARRHALAALGGGLLAAVLLPWFSRFGQRAAGLIRPPGAQGEDFLSRCLRCGECLRICPTSGLQPALSESGPEGLWSPILAPRLGYCDFSCHACGQVCPSGAIPNLTLEEKRRTVIGKAEIDRQRCLPWSKNTPCIVCEEMCPLSPKAVEYEEVIVTGADGQPLTLQRPSVVRERCIGCGICEYKCPAEGEAAIRVSGI